MVDARQAFNPQGPSEADDRAACSLARNGLAACIILSTTQDEPRAQAQACKNCGALYSEVSQKTFMSLGLTNTASSFLI